MFDQSSSLADSDFNIDITSDDPSLVSSTEYEASDTESVLHREHDVLVEVRTPRTPKTKVGKFVYKTYLGQTMGELHHTLRDQVLHELDMYRLLKSCRNIIGLEAFYHHRANAQSPTTLVFPYLTGDHVPTSPAGIQHYMRQLLETLKDLFDNEVVHCNIKKGNIIYDEFDNLTLIDFESAVCRHELIDQGKGSFVLNDYYDRPGSVEYRGNPHYVAPEVLCDQYGRNKYGKTLYGRRRDIYSAGVILAELVLGLKYLFKNGSSQSRLEERQKLDKCFKRFGNPVKAFHSFSGRFKAQRHCKFDTLGLDLASKMLSWCRIKGMTPAKALQHPFFQYSAEEN